MRVPDDTPATCPVCDDDYDSVSEHDTGLMVNLLDNEMYQRVCFDPVGVDDTPMIRFYHHTHEQTVGGHGGDESVRSE